MQTINDVLRFCFGNILMAILTITAFLLLLVWLCDVADNTPAALAQRRREIEAREQQRKIEEAKMQRDWELQQARRRLKQRLQAARNSAADTQLAAQLFAEEVHRIQQEWRRQRSDADA